MEDYRVRYQQWLEDPFIDEETKAELRGITDENEIKERFFKELEFGTGGLRGIIGNGSNRLTAIPLGRLRKDWQIISKRKAHRSRA